MAAFVTVSCLAERGSVCYSKLSREAWQRLLQYAVLQGVMTFINIRMYGKTRSGCYILSCLDGVPLNRCSNSSPARNQLGKKSRRTIFLMCQRECS